MTWQAALEIVVSRTGVERYRDLCSDDNPDPETRAGYRSLMLTLAGQPPPIPTVIPDRPDPNSGIRLGGCCGG